VSLLRKVAVDEGGRQWGNVVAEGNIYITSFAPASLHSAALNLFKEAYVLLLN
jgi:putative intracellular protease/amidase